MPTIVSHAAFPVAALFCVGRGLISRRLFFAALVCALLPDCDAIGFHYLGINYGNILGHRGITHSIGFAFAAGAVGFCAAPLLKARRGVAFFVLFLSVLSHIVFDAMTGGGLGVAAFWPFSEERFFFPHTVDLGWPRASWLSFPGRPVTASPMTLQQFFNAQGGLSAWGGKVVRSELLYIWLPMLLFAIAACFARKTGRALLKMLKPDNAG